MAATNERIDDELIPTQTEGYKVGEKKTIAEYENLDANDESLRKWKVSLGLGANTGHTSDARNVVISSLALEVPGRDDVVLDLSSANSIDNLAPMIIKEGIQYRLKIKFRINHDVVSGLKILQQAKRKGIPADRSEEMLGSYGPSSHEYEKKFQMEEAPSGFIARGEYIVKTKFIDDDKNVHLEFTWKMQIKKGWE